MQEMPMEWQDNISRNKIIMNNEAKISVNCNVKSPNGFEYQLTLREGVSEKEFSDLMELIAKKEVVLLAKKWLPLPRSFTKAFAKKDPEFVEGKVCPECGGRIVKGQSKDGSKHWEQCEHYKWDFTAKKNIGSCNYQVWL